jgi:hypothetical protein
MALKRQPVAQAAAQRKKYLQKLRDHPTNAG